MTETSGLRQFLILLYKGLLLRKRHYIITFFEIVIPIFIATIPCIILSETSTEYDAEFYQQSESMSVKSLWVNYTTYDPFDPFDTRSYTSSIELVYTPKNDVTEQFINDTAKMFLGRTPYRGSMSESILLFIFILI